MSSSVVRFRHFATVFGAILSSPLGCASESLSCRSDGVRARGAPATILSHRPSFHSGEKIPPSNPRIEQLGPALDFIATQRAATDFAKAAKGIRPFIPPCMQCQLQRQIRRRRSATCRSRVWHARVSAHRLQLIQAMALFRYRRRHPLPPGQPRPGFSAGRLEAWEPQSPDRPGWTAE